MIELRPQPVQRTITLSLLTRVAVAPIAKEDATRLLVDDVAPIVAAFRAGNDNPARLLVNVVNPIVAAGLRAAGRGAAAAGIDGRLGEGGRSVGEAGVYGWVRLGNGWGERRQIDRRGRVRR